MASILWKIFLFDAIGCMLGVFGCGLTLVAYSMDSSWFEYLHNALFRHDALTLALRYGLRNLDHFLKTLGQNLKWDGIAFIIMAVITMIAAGHVSCGILSAGYREKLNSRKSINRVIAGCTIIAGLLLLYSMYITDKEFYYYIEIIFYEKNLSNDVTGTLEPAIHWPCNYYSINKSSLVDSYGIYSESSLGVPVTGPHTCQYKFYKLSAVVLLFVCSLISQVVIYYINTHLIANLALAPAAVADAALRRLRQEIPLQVLRMQQERNGRERPALNLLGSNSNPTTRISGNFHIFPVFPSSQTIDSFNLPCFDCPGNCDNFDIPPPPYPGNTTETNITVDGPIVASQNIPTDVVNAVETAPDHLPNNSVQEPPPPSYSSTLLGEGYKKP